MAHVLDWAQALKRELHPVSTAEEAGRRSRCAPRQCQETPPGELILGSSARLVRLFDAPFVSQVDSSTVVWHWFFWTDPMCRAIRLSRVRSAYIGKPSD